MKNCEVGYVVCIVLLFVYVVFVPFEQRLRPFRNSLPVSALISLLITYFNPNRWKAFGG